MRQTGANAAKAEAYHDKKTFYASINLVNNYFDKNGLSYSSDVKSDLINWVNSGQLPYNLLNPKSYKGYSYSQADSYNKKIIGLGSKIFESREGYNNNGNVSTKPKDKNAIPYD